MQIGMAAQPRRLILVLRQPIGPVAAFSLNTLDGSTFTPSM